MSLTNTTPVSGSLLKLSVNTDDPQYVTNAAVQYYIKVTFDDHTNSYVHYEPITVNIRTCVILSMTTSGDTTHSYNIYTPVEYLTYSLFTQTHQGGTERSSGQVCGYTINYSAKFLTYFGTVIDLPSFIVWNHADLRFEIQSNDPTDITTLY